MPDVLGAGAVLNYPGAHWEQSAGALMPRVPPRRPPAPGWHRDEYANRVEVERHEHDATLTFYRNEARVKAVTVPLALLDSLTAVD